MNVTKIITLGIGLAAIAGPTLSAPVRRPAPPTPPPMRATTSSHMSVTVTNTNPVIHYPAGQMNNTGITPGQLPVYNPTGLIPGQVPIYNPTNMTPGLVPIYNSTGFTPGLPTSTSPSYVTPGAPSFNYSTGVTTNVPTTYSYTTRTSKGASVVHITNMPGARSKYVKTSERRRSKLAKRNRQTSVD
jgi:hypothetical protein